MKSLPSITFNFDVLADTKVREKNRTFTHTNTQPSIKKEQMREREKGNGERNRRSTHANGIVQTKRLIYFYRKNKNKWLQTTQIVFN